MTKKVKIVILTTLGFLLALVAITLFVNWNITGDRVVEYNEVFGMNITKENKGNTLHLKGIASSSWFVKNIVKKEDNSNIHIEMEVTMSKKKGVSGAFDFKVDVDNKTSNVYFGKNKTLIWNKDTGIAVTNK